MTRFPSLWSLLTGEPIITPRQQAYEKLRSAESRGDTRSIGKARMELAEATRQELRA